MVHPRFQESCHPFDLNSRWLEDMANASLQRSHKADVRRRMSPPMRQSVARISQELGIHVVTLYNRRKAWRLQGEVFPATEKDPDGWSAADKFTVVLETAGLNATELSAYCRERGLYLEQLLR
jgi:transposase